MKKLIISVFAVLAVVSSVIADPATFSAPGLNGAWNDTENWTPGVIPNNGGTTYDVTLPNTSVIDGLGGNITVDSVTTGGTVTFENVSGQVLSVVGSAGLSHTAGNLTIGDGAGLVLGQASVNRINSALTLGSGAGILNQGSMIIGNGNPPNLGFTPVTTTFAPGYVLRNEGVLRVNTGASVSVSGGGLNAINTGLFVLDGGTGGNVTFSSYTQTEFHAHTVTRITENSILQADTATITRGALFGNGTLDAGSYTFGDGSSAAMISGGEGFDQVGTMILEGTPGSLGGSTWHFDLAGTTQGTGYDHIIVQNSLNLAGVDLSVELQGFTPGFNDSFVILSTTDLSGAFANVSGGLIGVAGGLGTFEVNIGADTVTLTHFTAIPEPSTYGVIFGALSMLYVVGRRFRQGTQSRA